MRRELEERRVLGMDALHVDLVEDGLWIRMECSPADMEEGPRLQEPRIIARFANDMLPALVSLQKHRITYQDLRSDKLLLNGEGVFRKFRLLQRRAGPESPRCVDPVGVPYWQALEVRSGSYDALKVDGRASFRDCSEPAEGRVGLGALLETPFIQRACDRPVIVQLLSRCITIEQASRLLP
ncbi:hypothetical protein C8J57DRAFT_1716177 [Mycena rebaudengoi]|nr:hypothetical protein C8J57DRAFT_1716177 [Mycena rebaudengoi]